MVFFGSEQSEDVEFSFIPWEELVPWQKGLEQLYQFLPDESQDVFSTLPTCHSTMLALVCCTSPEAPRTQPTAPQVQDDVARSYNEAIRWISLSNQSHVGHGGGGGGSTPRGTPRASGTKRPKKTHPEGACARPICGAPGTRGPCKQPYGSCPYHKLGDNGSVSSPAKHRPQGNVTATPEVQRAHVSACNCVTDCNCMTGFDCDGCKILIADCCACSQVREGGGEQKDHCGVISTRGVPCKQVRSVCPYHRKDKTKHPKPVTHTAVDRETTAGVLQDYQRVKAAADVYQDKGSVIYDHDDGLKRKSVMEQQVLELSCHELLLWSI